VRKLRLAWVLPIIQVLVASILMEWSKRAHGPRRVEYYVPTSWLICRGLNAPALLFRFLNPRMWVPTWDWVPRSVLDFDVDRVFFVVGVAVVWYLVGRGLDQRGISKTAGRHGVATAFIVYPLLLVLGVLLLYGGLRDLMNPITPYAPVGASLMLIWSAVLILLSGRGLARAIASSLDKHRVPRTRCPQPGNGP
jgi:hypothetical protein